MSFDWVDFLSSRRIEFFESGANVARGNVAIRCPWCGAGDHSAHMGISLHGKGWGCWRNQRHRGRSPVRLVAALLGTSYMDAARIVEARGGRSLPSSDDFSGEIERLLGMSNPDAVAQPCPEWPKDIKPLRDRGMGSIFVDYVCDRGYTTDEAHDLAVLYGLRYALKGKFSYRVVIPIEDVEGLATWTGRHIGRSGIRYRSLSPDAEKAKADELPMARLPVNHCLFNEAELVATDERWPMLVVAEGPFDALRLDYFGRASGMRGTCLFGLGIYPRQIDTLAGIVDRFDHRILLLDRDASIPALDCASRLAPLGFRTITIQSEKDPADMTVDEVKRLARSGVDA